MVIHHQYQSRGRITHFTTTRPFLKDLEMEYEKKYNEALERARKIHSEIVNNEIIGFPGQIETIFPELRESEDERVIRTLYYLVRDHDWLNGAKKEEALTWLEKQKEPNYLEKFIRLPHLNSDYEVVDDWAYTPSLAHCDGNWGVCWVHCEDGDTLHECIGDTPAEAIDKAVEWFTSLEKPIRAKEVGAIISSRDKEETACGYLERCLTPDMRKVWYEACDELKKACFQEAEKQKEQKPVMGNGISEQTKMDETVYKFTPEEWKKALDEQLPKEPKPAGWSEEDEDMLNSCISSIEEAKENRYAYKETDGDTSYDHEIAWLKSLRPSWKPSDQDELMKLKYAGTSTKLD